MFAARGIAKSKLLAARAMAAGVRHYTIDFTDYKELTPENNESYAYLKQVGSTWKYDPYEVHPRLHRRLYRRFDTFDLDNDGKMQLWEVLFWPQRMRQLANPTEAEIENMNSAIRAFFGAIGLTEEGLERHNWVEANQVFGEAERERMKRGEVSLVSRLGNSYFDVLDFNGDGTVSLDELQVMMKAFDIPRSSSYTFFEKADTNLDGKLQREEMHAVFRKFWLEEYDPIYDGIYAYKY